LQKGWSAQVNERLNRGPVVIERVRPQVDCGRYRAKAIVGDSVEVGADIFRDGPALLQAVVRFTAPSGEEWLEAPLPHIENDRYEGSFEVSEAGLWSYEIHAWTDHFGTWRRDLRKRVDAGQNVDVELREGALWLEERLELFPERDRVRVGAAIEKLKSPSPGSSEGHADARVATALDDTIAGLVRRHPDRVGSTVSPRLELMVDRERARFGAWYEFFPRSTGAKGRHGTFATASERLPAIARMGFDVVYLPPIHPIGTTHRKGRDNALAAGPADVGSPWAIGDAQGGHDAIHPELGTFDDFDAFVQSAGDVGLEVALDFAIQCSPDHPWTREHPEWFHHRPDGTIKYAENPPKKYQDIYPINFETPDKKALWETLKGVLELWVDHGIKIFRVDNPHTKSFPFWEWVIEAIKEDHPDVFFLSEAFTRPKVMKGLAKVGFSQSYTYFTWRNNKWELTQYMNELTEAETASFFRPNFFTNTQDILNEYLQTGGPPAFKIRLVLAAFLSPTYGIYSGFELFEGVPLKPGSEEYLHSEKYELRPRDFDVEGTLAPYISRVNDIRRRHPALHRLTVLRWHAVDKECMMAFSKRLPGGPPILVIVNLNPHAWEEATVTLDTEALGIDSSRSYELHDLITDATYSWRGASNYVRLDPSEEVAHIFEVRT
jgi:starch synthase (maltosyl-transferring)